MMPAAAKRLSNLWERILKWELGRSARRRRNLRSDAIWSAATYDEIAAQIIHIPTQFKKASPSAARKRAALRFGDWAIRVFDVEAIYATYSEYMPEEVMAASIKTAREIINDWGAEG